MQYSHCVGASLMRLFTHLMRNGNDMKRSLIPDIAILQAFESAARHGNFTRAAAELNLTQSAISRQIRDLEGQTGLLLFERIRQRVVLTEAGKKLLPDVRRLLAQSEELMIRAVASANAEASLTIATLPTFGARWLMPRLPRFFAIRPSVALAMESRSEPFDFEEEIFDLAFHYGQPSWAKAECTYLFGEEVLPMASPGLLNHVGLTAPSALAEAPLLHLTTRPHLWTQWLDRHGQVNEGNYRGSRFDQFSMIIAAAIAGLGIALLPTYLIEEEIGTGSLVPAFDLPLRTENAYYLVTPEGRRSNAAATGFRDWLIADLARQATVSGIDT